MNTAIKIVFQQLQICALFLLIIVTPSCNVQNKTNVPVLKPLNIEENTKVESYGPGDIVQCGLQDKSGNLWFCTSGGEGVFHFDGASLKSGTIRVTNFTTKDGLPDNNVSSILEDRNGILWFGTDHGLSRFDPSTSRASSQRFTNFSISGNELKYVPAGFQPSFEINLSNSISSILQDKSGNLWIGNLTTGIYRCDEKWLGVLASPQPGKSIQVPLTNFLSTEVVQCMVEDLLGNIWIGSWSNGGAYRFDGSRTNHPCIKNSCKHDLKVFQDQAAHDQEIDKSIVQFTKHDGLGDGMIACILPDKKGNVWFGTRDYGLTRNVQSADRVGITNFINFSEKDGLCNNNIFCMLEDKTGKLWLGSAVKYTTKPGGLCLYDGKNFTKIQTKEGLLNNDFFCIVEDNNSNLWLGGRYGKLFRYEVKSKTNGTAFTDFSEKVHRSN